MTIHYERSLLYWPHDIDTISNLSTYKENLKSFKSEHALNLLLRFKKSEQQKYDSSDVSPQVETTFRFYPMLKNDPQQRNIGVFTTLLFLETISVYRDEALDYAENKKDVAWLGMDENSMLEYSFFVLNELLSLEKQKTKGRKLASGELASVASMVKYGKYLKNFKECSGKNFNFVKDILCSNKFDLIRLDFISFLGFTLEIVSEKLSSESFNLDPFYLNRCLQFIDYWKKDIVEIYFYLMDNINNPGKTVSGKQAGGAVVQATENTRKEIFGSFISICNKILEVDVLHRGTAVNRIFKHFFEQIYFLGKYELYRQLSLKLSGDEGLYDVKRLIYSLLIVAYRNRFSNEFVKKKAIDTIFIDQVVGNKSIWPTGQLFPLSFDTKMSVSSIECINDLLSCKALKNEMLANFESIKKIFDFYAITLRYIDDVDGFRIPCGWFPPDQRDKTVTGTETAFVLYFIKQYCTLITDKIKKVAEQSFLQNYRKSVVTWDKTFDSSAVKLKLSELIVKPNEISDFKQGATSALLFGPPGTGKSTYASSLAEKLDMKYLELTPGDFFSGGENEILSRINKLFEHMLHLENIVIFIDEIEDLVLTRENKNQESYFDPRNLYVNTLLPRFQELNNKKNVILIMATNHLDKVDSAIYRRGRIDLVIPVGTLSLYGRLNLLYNRLSGFGLTQINRQNQIDQIVKFIKSSAYCTYNQLNECIKRCKIGQCDINGILSMINSTVLHEDEINLYKKYFEEFFEKHDLERYIRPRLYGELDELKINDFIKNYSIIFHKIYLLEKIKKSDPEFNKIMTQLLTQVKQAMNTVKKIEREDNESPELNLMYVNLFHFINRFDKIISHINDETCDKCKRLKSYTNTLINKMKEFYKLG